MHRICRLGKIVVLVVLLVLPASGLWAQQKKDTPAVNHNALNFIVMGDWGRNGEDHQQLVADQMGKTAKEMSVDFIISTGDNFYPKGVISEYDPLWRTSFEDVYKAFSLQWDWYPVLGNHDYMSNPDAQVAYSKISRRWKMPARYYSKKVPVGGKDQMLIVFIDTNPLIKEFYANHEYGPNVATQDSTAQKKWLREVLSDPSPDIKWKIVVGHHPMYTGSDKRRESYDTRATRSSLKNLLEEHGVHAYIAGHDHSLQHLSVNGIEHFVSGSASEATQVGMLPQSKFAVSQYGFMVFTVTESKMIVQIVDYKGRLLYRTEISK